MQSLGTLSPYWGFFPHIFLSTFEPIVGSKIDENRCKQTLASLPWFYLPQITAYVHGSE